jgi:hypothetical protein
MAGMGSFLVAITGPVVKRALASLGFGIISYAAVSAALTEALSAARQAWAGMAGEALALLQIAGVNTAASILAGALVARVALQATKKLAMLK